jgi:hypothetical protein
MNTDHLHTLGILIKKSAHTTPKHLSRLRLDGYRRKPFRMRVRNLPLGDAYGVVACGSTSARPRPFVFG